MDAVADLKETMNPTGNTRLQQQGALNILWCVYQLYSTKIQHVLVAVIYICQDTHYTQTHFMSAHFYVWCSRMILALAQPKLFQGRYAEKTNIFRKLTCK